MVTRELFHTATRAVRGRARRTGRAVTLRALIARAAGRLARARVHFGHGTDNAWDEAAALVLHAVRLPPGGGAPGLGRRVGRTAQARALPRARIDAVDISDAALEVARRNVRRHRLARRVRLRKSDHFRALGRATYDIILSNPPYVGARELAGLPPEYRHEPRVALAAGSAGLDSVRIILQEARRHLRPRGVLIVEVGNTERAVRRAFRRLPFVWLEFARGGGGVFLLSREQLQGPQATLSQ